jgi:hypothetical protein
MRYLPNLQRFPAISLLAIASAVSLSAGELKVDINRDGKNSASTTATGYTQWTTAASGGTASTGTAAITQNFTTATGEAVAVSLSMTAAAQAAGGTGLTFTYYAAGTTTTGQKLVSDGVTVAPAVANAGGQLQMTLTGLSPGPHTLLTYHNAGDSAALPNGLGTLAPIKIYLNGTLANTLTPSIRSTDIATPIAYLEFTVASTASVTTVLFAADPTATANTKNVVLNGFEIDTPNSTRIANTPSPADADEHVDADAGSATLAWAPALAGNAASHDVYLGTSLSAVKTATRASSTYLGNLTTLSRSVPVTDSFATYYWRIDEVDSLGNATAGTTWSFRPRHLAFPGAEGYGRFARGGRGGGVRHVTNLNDSGPGSLRDAILGDYGPRTVVFDVAGLITLDSDIIVSSAQPYITVAGQTAPGKGICIKKQQLGMSGARDAVLRHVRLLVGKESGETQNATGMSGVSHCIMDHVTAGWGIDEGLSTRTAKNVTFQRCSLSEALNVAGHQNYPAGTAHGYAASIGGDIASFHHNLLAHNEGRNWSMAGGLDASGYYAGKLDIFNNVVYNWSSRTTDGGAMEVNFVNNYYKRGPVNGITTILNPQYGGFPGKQQYYMAGNILLNGTTTVTNQTTLLSIGTENGGTLPQNSTPAYSATVIAPFFSSYATIHTATNAYKQVLSDVGCNQPQIDTHDTRVINETLNGTYSISGSVSGKKGLPDTTADLGGWDNYGNEVRPAGFDTDGDGMPDWWEAIKGFNPASAANDFTESNGDPDGDGYTKLEDYLNWLACPNFSCAAGATVDVDLQALAIGYSKTTPSYTLDSPSGGAVSLVSGRYARFTPSGSTDALGRFTFTVTDSAGDSMTREVKVRVTAAVALPVLTLAATDAAAGEFGADQSLVFTLSRSGDTSAALTVPLSASGSATSGTDYSGLSAFALVPVGKSSAQIALTVLADSTAEGSEAVSLTLESGTGYTLGNPVTATATIADRPAQAFFFAAITDSAKRGPADDADGDSAANLVEYFIGSDPATGGGSGALDITAADLGTGTFKVRYPRAKNHADVSGVLQWSVDLAAWHASDASDGARTVSFSASIVSAADADPETVEATGTLTGASSTRLFVRLRVE